MTTSQAMREKRAIFRPRASYAIWMMASIKIHGDGRSYIDLPGDLRHSRRRLHPCAPISDAPRQAVSSLLSCLYLFQNRKTNDFLPRRCALQKFLRLENHDLRTK